MALSRDQKLVLLDHLMEISRGCGCLFIGWFNPSRMETYVKCGRGAQLCRQCREQLFEVIHHNREDYEEPQPNVFV